MPTFSVIIPTYDRPEALKRALASVIEQSCDDFEVIVVDDAGSIPAKEVCESFEDGRVIYVRLRSNSGVSVTRNEGVKAASGEVITFLDDDDYWHIDYLATQHRALKERPAADFSWCGHQRVDSNGSVQGKVLWMPRRRHSAYLEYLRYRRVNLHGFCIRRDALLRVGTFRPDLVTGEDIEFIARVFRELEFTVVRDHLVFFTQHDGPRLSGSPQSLKAQLAIYDEHRDAIQRNPTVAASVHARFSSAHYRAGDKKAARREFVRFLRYNPFQADGWKIFLKCEFGTVFPKHHQ